MPSVAFRIKITLPLATMAAIILKPLSGFLGTTFYLRNMVYLKCQIFFTMGEYSKNPIYLSAYSIFS